LSPPLPSSLPSPIPYHPSHIASTEKYSSSSYWRCSFQPQLAHDYYYHHRKKKKNHYTRRRRTTTLPPTKKPNPPFSEIHKTNFEEKTNKQNKHSASAAAATQEKVGGKHPQEKTELFLEGKN